MSVAIGATAPLIEPEDFRSWILFEDEHLLVVDKPGLIVCHPSKNGPWSSLVGAAREYAGLATAHLVFRLDLTMVDAALGLKTIVPALDGDIELKLPAGSQPGDVKVFRNRGVPVLQGYGRGDLRVVLNVTVPRHLSDEQRDVLQRFEELSTDKNYQPDEGFLDKLRAAFRQ